MLQTLSVAENKCAFQKFSALDICQVDVSNEKQWHIYWLNEWVNDTPAQK